MQTEKIINLYDGSQPPAIPAEDDNWDASIPEPEYPADGTGPEPLGTKPRYTIKTAADALEPQPPIDFLLDKVISSNSVNIVYGEPGSGKSYALLSMAVCIANGLPWLGLNTKPTRCLIIDEESGDHRLSRRLGECLRGENAGTETPIDYISLAGFMFDNPADAVELQTIIRSQESGLVIIDALADVMAGDENSKQDVQPVFNHLRKITENTGAAIILIHHSNKSGGYRGSSAIKGAIECMIQCEKSEDDNILHFKSEKNRDGETHKWNAIATWQDDTFTLRRSNAEKAEFLPSGQEYVIRYLREHGPSSVNAIEGAADTCTAKSANLAIYALARAKQIYRTNPTNNKRIQAIYALTPESEDE